MVPSISTEVKLKFNVSESDNEEDEDEDEDYNDNDDELVKYFALISELIEKGNKSYFIKKKKSRQKYSFSFSLQSVIIEFRIYCPMDFLVQNKSDVHHPIF